MLGCGGGMTNLRVAPSRHWVDGGDKVDHTITRLCQLLSRPSTLTTNDVSPYTGSSALRSTLRYERHTEHRSAFNDLVELENLNDAASGIVRNNKYVHPSCPVFCLDKDFLAGSSVVQSWFYILD